MMAQQQSPQNDIVPAGAPRCPVDSDTSKVVEVFKGFANMFLDEFPAWLAIDDTKAMQTTFEAWMVGMDPDFARNPLFTTMAPMMIRAVYMERRSA